MYQFIYKKDFFSGVLQVGEDVTARDSNARETYRKEIRNRHSYKNDIFVLDILREEMKDNDSRIQRILSI